MAPLFPWSGPGTRSNNDAIEESEEEDVSTDVISHADATTALKVALRYVEQHASATPTDVMFMLRWCSIAASNRFSSLRQKKITDFVPTNEGWGAHYSNYPTPYLTAAAALGMRKSDVDLFTHRLDKALSKLKGRSAPPTPTSVEELTVSGRRSAGRGTINGEASDSAGTSLASSKDSLRK